MQRPFRIAALVFLALAVLLPGGGAGSNASTAMTSLVEFGSLHPAPRIHAASPGDPSAESASHDMHCTVHCVFLVGPKKNGETRLTWASLIQRLESQRQMIGVTVPVPQQPPRIG